MKTKKLSKLHKKLGLDVKSHLSSVTEKEKKKIEKELKGVSETKLMEKKEKKEKKSEEPVIIRRAVIIDNGEEERREEDSRRNERKIQARDGIGRSRGKSRFNPGGYA